MNIKSTLILLVSMAMLTSCGSYEAAQKAYNLGEYNKAADLFDKAQKGEENKGRKAEECFLLGECYRNLGQDAKAAVAYQKAVRLKYEDDEAMLRLADAYRNIGKFDEARDVYNAYYEKHRTDRRVNVARASMQLAEGVWSELSNIKDAGEKADSGYVVKPFRDINSKYSDFCPVYVGEGYDVVYFTSLRTQKKKKRMSKITGQGGSTIYMSKIDGRGKWTEPQPLDEPFGTSGNDDGAAFVSSDGRTMVFTRCPLNNQDGCPVHAYEIKREGGRWSEPVRILPGADSTMMVAHPTLSPDGQVLYFVSDREDGSHGGLDIWKSLRNVDGSWGPAQNLGPMVNTAGDEMFPCMRDNGTLYFSSDGHEGFGGLDIYKAVEGDDGRYHVSNLGLPINSAGDDFGITFMGSAEEGLFSSNRGSSKGYEDIYSFYLPPVILTIEARIGESGKKAFADGNTKPRSRVLRPSPSANVGQDDTQTAQTAKAQEPVKDEADDKNDDEKIPDFALEGKLQMSTANPSGTQDSETAQTKQSDDKTTTQSAAKSTSKSSTTKSSTKKKTTTSKGKSSTTKKSTSSKSKSSATAKKTTSTKGKTSTTKKTGTTTKKTTTSATAKSGTTTKSSDNQQTATAKADSDKTTTTKKSSTTTASASSSKKTTKKKRKFVPIPEAYIRVVGSDGTNIKLPVDDHGKVSFVAEKDVRYIILSGAPGFANTRTEVSTEGLNRTQTIKMTSLLDKVD